jgi:hypothetical protein
MKASISMLKKKKANAHECMRTCVAETKDSHPCIILTNFIFCALILLFISTLRTGKLSNNPCTDTVVPDEYDNGTRRIDSDNMRPSESKRNCSPSVVVADDDDDDDDDGDDDGPISSFSFAVRVETTRDRDRFARQNNASPRKPSVGAQSS